jgi:hypothetical protein
MVSLSSFFLLGEALMNCNFAVKEQMFSTSLFKTKDWD